LDAGCRLSAPSAGGDAGAGATEGVESGDHEGGEDLPAGRALAGVDPTQIGLSRLVARHRRLETLSSAPAETADSQSVSRNTVVTCPRSLALRQAKF